MEQTLSLYLSDENISRILNQLTGILPTINSLEISMPGFLDDMKWISIPRKAGFIERHLLQMNILFTSIPSHITKVKITSSDNLFIWDSTFVNDTMPSFLCYELYGERAKVIATLFTKLHSNIKEISFSNVPFYRLPEESLKLMSKSLPFIKKINLSAGLVNKMSKSALIHLNAITPNACHYELFKAQSGAEYCYTTLIAKTPKLLFMKNMPKMYIQHTLDAFNCLVQQKKLPLDCISHIIEYLTLAEQIDYNAIRTNIYKNKVTRDLSIALLANSPLANNDNQFSSLGISDRLIECMPYLLLICCIVILIGIKSLDCVVRSSPDFDYNFSYFLLFSALYSYFSLKAIDNVWATSTMHGQLYDMQIILSSAKFLYEQCEKFYKISLNPGNRTAPLGQVKEYSFFNQRDNCSTCSNVEVERTTSLIAYNKRS